MLRSFLAEFGRVVLAFFIACVIALAGLLGWLLLEPREIPALTQKIEASLNHEGSRYDLRLNHAILALGDFGHPLSLIVQEIRLQNPQGSVIAQVPSMQVSLAILPLLRGEVQPDSVRLMTPTLNLFQDKNGLFYLTATEEPALPIALHDLFATTARRQRQDSALFDAEIEEIAITGGTIGFRSELNKVSLVVPAADITLRQSRGLLRGRLDVKALQQHAPDTGLEGYFLYDPATKLISARLTVSKLNPSAFADLLPELRILRGINLPISGKIEWKATLPTNLASLSVALEVEEGSVELAPHIPSPIAIQHANIKGSYQALEHKAVLDGLVLQLAKTHISAAGSWSRDNAGQSTAQGKAEITHLNKTTLLKLWPESLAPMARGWVKDCVKKASVPNAVFTLDAKLGALEQSPLPDDILKSDIQVEGAKVAYMQGFPAVENASGVVHLGINRLEIDLAQASMLGSTQLREAGTLIIPALDAEVMEIALKLPITTTAPDALTFLQSTAYTLPTTVHFDATRISGEATGLVELTILDHVSPEPDEIGFTITGDVQNLSQPAFYEGMAITNASGSLKVTDKSLEVKATGALDGLPLTFDANMTGSGNNYHLTSKLPTSSLPKFGVDAGSYLTGDVGVDLRWGTPKNQSTTMELLADLTPSALAFEKINYHKAVGEPATLALKGAVNAQSYDFTTLQLSVPKTGDTLRGSTRILRSSGAIDQLVFDELRLGATRARGTYRQIPDGYYLHASGALLDLSFLDTEEEKAPVIQNAPQPEMKIPALDLDLAFDKAKMSKDGTKNLHAIKLNALCNKDYCTRTNLTFNAGDNAPFTLQLSQQGGKRVVNASAPRFDIILRETNLFDDMQQGEMKLFGIFQDDVAGRPLVGKLTIGEHRVKNIPLLTKLLTVATFTGIVDSLTGSGLMFQKMVIPFRKEGFVFYIEDAKTAGPSIGITAHGKLDLNQETIALRGTVIPAYMFNAMIRSIPLLGNVFGALAGDGLVAVRYSMIGSTENPDVTVNPLSALTPGFLRGFFSIFEEEDPASAQNSQKTTEALEKFERDLEQIDSGKAATAPASVTAEPRKTPLPRKRRGSTAKTVVN